MIDRIIGLLGLGLALVFGLAPSIWPEMPRWVAVPGFAVGAALVVLALALAFKARPSRAATVTVAAFAILWPLVWRYGKPAVRDVFLRLVGRKRPLVMLYNPSDKTVQGIKWAVEVWNLDMPDRRDPLQIPVQTFDFLKPHQAAGPLEVFDARVAGLANDGARLFGYAFVSCPDCDRERSYWVYIKMGDGGWTSELSDDEHVDLSKLFQAVQEIAKSPGDSRLSSEVPEAKRIPFDDN